VAERKSAGIRWDHECGGKGRREAFLFSPNLEDANAVDSNKKGKRA